MLEGPSSVHVNIDLLFLFQFQNLLIRYRHSIQHSHEPCLSFDQAFESLLLEGQRFLFIYVSQTYDQFSLALVLKVVQCFSCVAEHPLVCMLIDRTSTSSSFHNKALKTPYL